MSLCHGHVLKGNLLSQICWQSVKLEEHLQQIRQMLDAVATRVDSNENEIKCLDSNILMMCSSIHALQAAPYNPTSLELHKAAIFAQAQTLDTTYPVKSQSEEGRKKGVPHTITPALTSRNVDTTPVSSASSKDGSTALHSAHSTQGGHSTNTGAAESSTQGSVGSGVSARQKRPSLTIDTRTRDSPFTSPPSLSGCGSKELFGRVSSTNAGSLQVAEQHESDIAVQVSLCASKVLLAFQHFQS